MIYVRHASALDASSMAELLNAIIEKGGTTALTRPVTARDIKDWMAVDPDRSSWQVAVDDAERVVGFQWIAPHAKLPPAGGLTYYQSRGFRDWAFDQGVTLDSGQVVNKISKRFDLK